MEKTNFKKVIFQGIAGTLIGIVSGFGFGILIWLLKTGLFMIENLGSKDFYYGSPNVSEIALLGMCFGAIIGSIFGSVSGLKEKD